ncbi:YheC/YheD family protein [Paenibacillus sp. YN15]|uniref:YheC/YheD family protein n=1 Tax=Paenibacillus sp. YN15 TaxID=1742774 RepID=UPI0015EB69A7|nr:YheC/YheD family protein [Paenibacillus sp. YN15]
MSLLSRKYPWSKWQKHLVLAREPVLREFLPDTAVLKEETLIDFLSRYPVVFAKPSCGGGGRGVVRISVIEEGRVEIQTTETRVETEIPQAYAAVKSFLGPKQYIVQQGVSLIRIDDRPIDFRTLLLRPGRTWRYMGVMGKLAVRDQIVTNHCRGGSSLTFAEALKESRELQPEEIRELEKRIERLSRLIAAALNKRYPLVAELGLDIGIDEELKLWLIEANTRPQYKLFRDHDDPTLYRRIGAIIKTVRLPLA